jgi:hypothetical protein
VTRALTLATALALAAGCADSHGLHGDGGSDGGEPCGPVTCGPGTVCCNASCGLCARPGEGCADSRCVDVGGACIVQDARGEGLCGAILGVAWRGYGCQTIGGCSCVGADCGAIYETVEACVAANPGCPRYCGGWGGGECLATEFCDYPDGTWCGGDDSQGECRPLPTECPDPGGIPVCGCDGNDYLTECSAHLVGVDVMHLGSCEGPPVVSFRSARMYGECGIAGGVLSHVVLADTVPSCRAELASYLDVTILRNLDFLSAPTTFDLSPTSADGRAMLCEEGFAGVTCVPASGTFTVHRYVSSMGASFDYDLTSEDGRRVAATRLELSGLFCPFVNPGCR